MPIVKDEAALVKAWDGTKVGISIAYELRDGKIAHFDSQPCHQGFGKRGDGMDHIHHRLQGEGDKYKQKDICGAYFRVFPASEYFNDWARTRKDADEISKAWYEFITSKNGPWRQVRNRMVTNEKGKYVAVHILDTDNQESQLWVSLAFASRATYQRFHAVVLWYDLVNKYKFHPCEALFIISGLQYQLDYAGVVFNPIAYDWLFKGYTETRVSFRNLWNGTPNLTEKGLRLSSHKDYGMPNEIWIEHDKKIAVDTDFYSKVNTQGKYKGQFPTLFRTLISPNVVFGNEALPLEKTIEILKKEAQSWPRK